MIGGRLDEAGARGAAATIFVVDPSSDGEPLATALRAAGLVVVDVPPSMLVARVAIQRPRVVLVDADLEGSLEAVERMRELPDAEEVHVVFIARPGGVVASPEEALAHDASGLFIRPVDVRALLDRVRGLTESTRADGESAVVGASGSGSSRPHHPSVPPSLPPASMRASLVPPGPVETKSSAPPSPRSRLPSEPPLSLQGSGARRVMGLAPPVSSELEQLLLEAEQRVQVPVEHESIVPSPEDEIEAVLPADLLAALDDPLDEDDDDDEPIVAPRAAAPAAPLRDRTSVRSGGRSGRTSTGGGSASTGGASRSGASSHPSDSPPGPATHGGTHAGPTGEGSSTTGASEAREALEASSPPVRPPTPAPPPPARRSSVPPRVGDPALPLVVGPGDAARLIARAVSGRTTGVLCMAAGDVERRLVLREGDVVTAASSADDESLLAFLGVRGELPRETVRRLGSKFPAHGRHAGAALVARGYVRQDQMWPTLRAHAEWLFARVLQTADGRLTLETQPSPRLAGEPSVFGGSTGASVFVEVMRRIVPPADAVERLGGSGARMGQGSEARLLGECALDGAELDQVHAALDRTIREALEAAPEGDLPTVLLALVQLGVLDVMPAAGAASAEDQSAPDVGALDAEAVRERVRARLQLVDDGDYFALLGVPHDATGYEVRRAFLELRRAFDPSRVVTPEVDDLTEDVRKIATILEEAYDILKDAARRERYRRAIEAVPER